MTGKKVLVVDDEIHIVHVVSIKFRNKGYEVISADNGSDAYELACTEKPDIIIADLQMPVLNGLELVQKLRSNMETTGIPVIVLSARTHSVSTQEQEALGICMCLSKPFSPRELLTSVEDILGKYEVIK